MIRILCGSYYLKDKQGETSMTESVVLKRTHISRAIAVLIILQMILACVATGAYALEEEPLSAYGTPAIAGVPSNIEALPGYKSVTLEWDTASNATGYNVYRRLKGTADYTVIDTVQGKAAGRQKYIDKKAAKDKTYEYYITSINADGESDKSSVVSSGRVRTMYYDVTFKARTVLKSKSKPKKSFAFQKGQTVQTEGFARGEYIFYNGGKKYQVPWFNIIR